MNNQRQCFTSVVKTFFWVRIS